MTQRIRIQITSDLTSEAIEAISVYSTVTKKGDAYYLYTFKLSNRQMRALETFLKDLKDETFSRL